MGQKANFFKYLFLAQKEKEGYFPPFPAKNKPELAWPILSFLAPNKTIIQAGSDELRNFTLAIRLINLRGA